MRDSSGPNHFDSRNFCTATELPNDLIWLLFVAGVLLFVWNGWFDEVHHLIWPMTLFARERGFASIFSIFTSDLLENIEADAVGVPKMREICISLRIKRTSDSHSLKIALVVVLSNLIWVLLCSYAICLAQNIRFVLILCVYFWSSAAIAVGDDTHVIFISIWFTRLPFTVWLLFRYLFSFFRYHVAGIYCASQSLNEHRLSVRLPLFSLSPSQILINSIWVNNFQYRREMFCQTLQWFAHKAAREQMSVCSIFFNKVSPLLSISQYIGLSLWFS